LEQLSSQQLQEIFMRPFTFTALSLVAGIGLMSPAFAQTVLRDGVYVGPAADAYWGLIKVRATISGGQLVTVDILQYPSDRQTSRSINRRALPILKTEVIQAQSARVNIVSGATLTSQAYRKSLAGALSKAR
jgi:uncharacterized protein with FMN-binding domain